MFWFICAVSTRIAKVTRCWSPCQCQEQGKTNDVLVKIESTRTTKVLPSLVTQDVGHLVNARSKVFVPT